MAFCLPKEFSKKFLDALREGKIVPEKLVDMTSQERRDFLEPIVGAKDVHEVNALLESKLILLDQKRGMVAWAKKVANISEARRAELIDKIERLDHVLTPEDSAAFLEDLVSKRLGTEVSAEEAGKIASISRELQKARQGWDEKNKTWDSEESRLQYGALKVALTDYVAELKLENSKTTLKGVVADLKNNPAPTALKGIEKLAGVAKGIKA